MTMVRHGKQPSQHWPDREFARPHLGYTSDEVPGMPDANEISEYTRMRDIVARLRAPDGCPWDREQTHTSLRPHLLQEAYEVLQLLDEGDKEHMPEELGDLLFQIVLHTQLAEEAGEWRMTDVLHSLCDKLVRRHPHVFGEVSLSTSDEVVAQWDQLKQKERAPEASALANVPAGLPALAYAQELLRRAEAAGFAWPHRDDVLEKLNEEVAELASAPSQEAALDELGDILFNVVNYARYLGLDAEDALRAAGHKFRRRFTGVEQLVAAENDGSMKGMTRDQLMALWSRVKAGEASELAARTSRRNRSPAGAAPQSARAPAPEDSDPALDVILCPTGGSPIHFRRSRLNGDAAERGY